MGLLSRSSKSGKVNKGQVMEVGVTFPGHREAIECYETTTILELKQKFMDKVGVPVSAQVYQFEGKRLKDNKTLKHYKVTHERTIILEGRHDGFLGVKPTDPTLTRLSERLDLQRRPDGSIIANKTINTGAKKSHAGGASLAIPTMSTVNPEENMEDDSSDDSEGDSAFAVTSEITVRLDNTEIVVIIARSRTLRDVKKQILLAFKLDNLERIVCVPEGTPLQSRDDMMADSKLGTTVEEADLNNALILLRQTHVTFSVEMPNKDIKRCSYDLDETLEQFFDYLVDLERENPDLENLELTNEGVELTREATFRESRIVNGTRLILQKCKEEGADDFVTVTVLHGADFEHTITLRIDPETDMWDVLRKVEAEGGGHAQKIVLKDEDGNEIEDEGSLTDWDVGEGSTLRVIKIRG